MAKHTEKEAWDSLVKRFWERITKGEPDECWEWQGYRDNTGYGVLVSGKSTKGGKKHYIHRLSWLIHNGDPGNFYVLHRCDNRPCGNPNHLFLGTHQNNHEDMMNKGRNIKGEAVITAKLTEADVVKIRSRLTSERGVDIAKDYQVDKGTISKIKLGKTWKDVK